LGRFLNLAIDISEALQIPILQCQVCFELELVRLKLENHDSWFDTHSGGILCHCLLVVMVLSISLQSVFGSDCAVFVSLFLRSET
jgi:hypothetical protein